MTPHVGHDSPAAIAAALLRQREQREQQQRQRQRRSRPSGVAAPAYSSPTEITAVSAWLRVSQATSDGNGISSVPDALNTNPAVQSVDARKPVIENSANGLPCMRFVTNDVLRWPITAQSSATDYTGWGFWVKPDSVGVTQRLILVSNGTNGASGLKMRLSVANPGNLLPVVSSNGVNTVSYTAAGALSTSWRFVTIEFNKDAATDAERLITTVDGAQVAGSVADADDISAGLVAATGNILIGNNNDGAAVSPFQGLFGPNIYAFASKMPGATLGLLTTEARSFLMNFEAPT